MDIIITKLLALLVIAALVAITARRLHLPYTVGLVLAGIGLSVAGLNLGITLTHDIIFILILPPLLFEAAQSISWPELRRDAVPVLVLATAGVLVSAAIVSLGMVEIAGWPLRAAAIFGTLIAATDPVAVIAMFKDNRLKGRISLLVESESLLNDGVAALLFGSVLGWSRGDAVSVPAITIDLAATVGGGILTGLLVGGLVLAVAGRTRDHLVEAVLTAVAAYGSFLAAEHLHVSGILATISAGLILGQTELPRKLRLFRLHPLSLGGREFLGSFWEFATFLANSLIFLLIGFAAAETPFDGAAMSMVTIAALLVLLSRAVSVYGLCLPFSASRWAIPLREQHVLWWGGLRGALALALVLSLPQSLPDRGQITVVTFGVVALSVIVQGLTMPPFLTALGILPVGGRSG